MALFGSKDRFAIYVGPFVDNLRTVEVWSGDKLLTPFDTSIYLPAFINALTSTERRLKEQLNFLKNQHLFFGLSVEEAFDKVATAESHELERAWGDLRFLDWGPTTDDFLCFLLPLHGKLHLVCREVESRAIHSVLVSPYELIQVVESSRHELSGPHATAPSCTDA